MKKLGFSLFVLLFLFSCDGTQNEIDAVLGKKENHFTLNDYEKKEVYIEMRDGVKLYTAIYSPVDKSQNYPVLMKRTPYSCSPYGDTITARISHNSNFIESGYIFVMQDMRGRYMSEGEWENVRPPYSFWNEDATDEVTDSYDTFEWLEENLENYNGKAGVYGNSYLGWSTLVAGVSSHPSLKAIMPMAPVTNFYFEDFSRYGLCAMNYFPILNAFGIAKDSCTSESWYTIRDSVMGFIHDEDTGAHYYDFFLERMTVNNFMDIIDTNNFFWKNIKAHPNYDEYHQKRDWIQYLERIDCPTMVVGGWNDEQNLFGILNSYKKITQTNENAQLVLGPWTHGHNKKLDSLYYMGDIFYGVNISKEFQDSIEFNYFEHYLKGKGNKPNFKLKLFDTGKKEWLELDEFPTIEEKKITFYPADSGRLVKSTNAADIQFEADPFQPVPFVNTNKFAKMAPKRYMTEDQRFVKERNDVLSFQSDILEDDLTVIGEIKAILQFATNLQDADLFVKIIDVYPSDREPEANDLEGIDFKGYWQTVRIGYIRGRFRDSFEKPLPFQAGSKTKVEVPLLEICHTFKKGHRVAIQIQSSLFPLFDLNPQNWVESIYEANKADFKKATHHIFGDSQIILPVYEN